MRMVRDGTSPASGGLYSSLGDGGGEGGGEFVETDPTVPEYVKKITEQEISDWDEAAEQADSARRLATDVAMWGDHSRGLPQDRVRPDCSASRKDHIGRPDHSLEQGV